MTAALKSRVGTAVFEHGGQTIKLQANFAALEQLAEAVGEDALSYIADFETMRHLTEIFYHLQLGTEHTRAEIQEAFFYSMDVAMNDEAFRNSLAKVIATLLGADTAKLIAPAKDAQKKDD